MEKSRRKGQEKPQPGRPTKKEKKGKRRAQTTQEAAKAARTNEENQGSNMQPRGGQQGESRKEKPPDTGWSPTNTEQEETKETAKQAIQGFSKDLGSTQDRAAHVRPPPQQEKAAT